MTTTTVREPSEAERKILAVADKLNLTVSVEFVPFSKSRNKPDTNKPVRPDAMSLNWRITLSRNGREFLTTDYSAGIAHCPSYGSNWPGRMTLEMAERIKIECETGHTVRHYKSIEWYGKGAKIEPKLADVLYSIVLDGAGALDYATYEEWAPDYGFDTDSRKGEAVYRACLEHGLRLRAALGEAGLAELHEATQDY